MTLGRRQSNTDGVRRKGGGSVNTWERKGDGFTPYWPTHPHPPHSASVPQMNGSLLTSNSKRVWCYQVHTSQDCPLFLFSLHLTSKEIISLISNRGHIYINSTLHWVRLQFQRSLFHVRRTAPAVITSCQTRGSDWINSSWFYWAPTLQTSLRYPVAEESGRGERKNLGGI